MIQKIIASLNSSKLLLGLAMLMLNIGSKYIEVSLSPSQISALRGGLAREMLIFAMSFMGTQDLPISLMLTASFVILSDHLLNEESPYCVAPAYLHELKQRAAYQAPVTHEEEKNAISVLKRAREQRNTWWNGQ